MTRTLLIAAALMAATPVLAQSTPAPQTEPVVVPTPAPTPAASGGCAWKKNLTS